MIFDIFRDFPELEYGISEKEDGFMNIKTSGDSDRERTAGFNRERFLGKRGVKGKIFVPNLVHSNVVKVVNEDNYDNKITGDGFVTASRNLFLIVTVADCFPLYFYDPTQRVIGLAHAGWRGVGKNIVKSALRVFKDSFGSQPKNIRLGIGPGIQQCHFVVYRDKIGALMPRESETINGLFAHKSFIKECNEKGFAIDLQGIIENQARNEGIEQIESSGVCTYCAEDTCFSYRREGSPISVMLAYIGRKN